MFIGYFHLIATAALLVVVALLIRRRQNRQRLSELRCAIEAARMIAGEARAVGFDEGYLLGEEHGLSCNGVKQPMKTGLLAVLAETQRMVGRRDFDFELLYHLSPKTIADLEKPDFGRFGLVESK